MPLPKKISTTGLKNSTDVCALSAHFSNYDIGPQLTFLRKHSFFVTRIWAIRGGDHFSFFPVTDRQIHKHLIIINMSTHKSEFSQICTLYWDDLMFCLNLSPSSSAIFLSMFNVSRNLGMFLTVLVGAVMNWQVPFNLIPRWPPHNDNDHYCEHASRP